MQFRYNRDANLNCLVFSTFTGGWVAGWVGGWSEDWRVMLNSTQDQVEVEVKDRVELGNNTHQPEKVF